MRILLLLAAAAAGLLPAPPVRIDRIGWMAGCWESAGPRRVVEEQWTRPRGGTMMGVSRTVMGDSTREYEFTRIVEREGALVFVADPSGQARTEFVARAATADSVAFENPAHDFPQRIVYRRAAAGDSLHARIEATRDGQVRGADFRYARVACP